MITTGDVLRSATMGTVTSGTDRAGPPGRRLLRPLSIIFVLAGSALAVAFGAVDVSIGAPLVGDASHPVRVAAAVLLVVSLPTAAALIPALRQLEGVAAITLLEVDLGGEPVPSRTGPQRLRTIGWFWLHLLAGAVVAAALLFGVVFGLLVIAGVLTQPVGGRSVIGEAWTVRYGWPTDVRLVAAGMAMIAIGALLVVITGRLLAPLAPILLGPTPQERLAALDAHTARLVERTRLARELHDSVGHALSLVVLQSAVAGRRAATDPEAAAAASAAAEQAARTALSELDDVLGLLREDADSVRHPVHDLTALPELIRAAAPTDGQIELKLDDQLEMITSGLPPVVSREAYRDHSGRHHQCAQTCARRDGDGAARANCPIAVDHDQQPGARHRDRPAGATAYRPGTPRTHRTCRHARRRDRGGSD